MVADEASEGEEGEEESAFLGGIESAVAEFVAKWQERDESDNFF